MSKTVLERVSEILLSTSVRLQNFVDKLIAEDKRKLKEIKKRLRK